ncbi:prepilin peptidase [Leucobacter allii]|uniref:Prepilin peptidase n=1 Tax=Leucobacter allii TaxID=2932247 RepID=A0ABY4FPS0_9MICO|nr:prepilin peptidase [Leucobacter allii]UOQ58277.1 prepilin peptidase [Leucobacter allii]
MTGVGILQGAALGLYAAAGAALAVADVRARRIPDRILLPALAAVLLLLAAAVAAGAWSGEPERSFAAWGAAVLGRTLGGAAAGFAALLAAALLGGGSGTIGGSGPIGGGDVKLAALVGAVLGHFGGWPALGAGFALGCGIAAVWALPGILRGRRSATIPFAPCLLLGSWIALAFALLGGRG